MASFGAGKNPPWARAGADFTGVAMTQQMLTPGVATQAVYNLAAQQNLQSQFQAQQMAAATMQVSMQQQAMLPQPGIAMPTSLATGNMGTISYPTIKAQAQQAVQPKQRVFTGSVTKLHDNFGFVDEDVFFQTTCVKGQMPKVGDRVLVEAQYNANMPFKWNATSVKVLNYQAGGALPGSKPPALLDTTTGRRGERNRSGGRGFDRDRSRERARRREERQSRRRSEAKEAEDDDRDKRKRSRSKQKSGSPASRRSRSPLRRRPRIIPRYVVQVPKCQLSMREASVVALKTRYNNMYIPSDFFNADFPWHEAFPLLRPFQLGKSCTFHVMHKDVERVGQNLAVLDPPDADHLFSAKVMLISCPSLDELYHKSCSLSQDPENMQENFVHPTRLINFLVGVKGKNEPIAIGGPWSPSLDGPNPTEDPKVLIKTAIRTTKALTGINLSSCTQWYRVAEVRYLRPEETHKGKLVPARVETSVIYLPDVWSCEPTHLEWETLQLTYKKQLQKKLAQLEGKEDAQDEDEEGGDESLGEVKDPTHYSELDPKSMKIVELRRELECRNLSSKGLKSQLIARLTKQLKAEQEQEEENAAEKKEQEKKEEEKEEEKMDTEEDEEKKKKEEEEQKKEQERKKATLERRYTLPEKKSILVYPNPTAKGGKFDCSVMSLSVLLDYRPEDNKEHSFEVSLFAELFNEMLMRDFGFSIHKCLSACPEKPKEEKKEKEKDKDKKKEDEPSAKKKKTDEKDKDSDKKESSPEKKEDKDKKEEKKEDKEDKDKSEKKKDKEDKEKKEKKDKEKKKYMTLKPDLLLACIYFDQNHCGYVLDKDLEEIIHAIGLSLSRAQVKKLISKVVSRDTFNYRKLTDIPVGEEEKQEPVEIEVDPDELAAGNAKFLPQKKESTTPSRRGKGSSKGDGELLSGMVMYNGAMLDIDSLLERLEKGEKSMADFERIVKDIEDERDQAQRELKKKEEQFNKLTSELKSVKHELSVQTKITSSSESNNRKYLSALMETQSLVQSLAGTVTAALGDMASIKVEKIEGVGVKEEPKANGEK